ncbi:hypothetical protein [Mycolicibacterium stellerae]|uniref:hypothetical protein n=1 Tax=Mycolicibacterium stellerae TaxID=2358193 RepID=UPI000F0B2B11|nr:hypothetical protein [Mycolicibacterium stellerae]
MSEQVSQSNTGIKKPRFTPDAPGPLAELEAQWLKENKGIDVTAQQVRAVLMYHGEFQKSPAREAQRQEESQAKAEREAANKAKAAERLTKAKEQAEKAAERAKKAAERAAALEAEAAEPEPAKKPARRTKAEAVA